MDTAGNESAPSATVSATPQGAAVVRYRVSGKDVEPVNHTIRMKVLFFE